MISVGHLTQSLAFFSDFSAAVELFFGGASGGETRGEENSAALFPSSLREVHTPGYSEPEEEEKLEQASQVFATEQYR